MSDQTRRELLKQGLTTAAIGGVLSGCTKKMKWTPSVKMQYRLLGKRTGLKVSEIGVGTATLTNPKVIERAMERGINYIDTAQDYLRGVSEETIGKVIKKHRKKFVLTTKWHPWSKTKKKEMMASLNASLKRLQTDYVDCLLVHQVGKASGGESIERLTNPELYEAYELAKKQGKVRFTGVSGHDGDLMEVMNWVVNKGYFDVILMRYNFMRYQEQETLIKKAHQKGMGVIAMKTLSGAKGQSDPKLYRKAGASMKQAALKWVLQNPHVSNLIISMGSTDQVDEYADVSGSKMAQGDNEILQYYAKTYGDQICTFCNECEPACPYGLPVANILRYYMYYENYGEQARGQLAYAALPAEKQAQRCEACSAPCESHCKGGVKIQREMLKAHAALKIDPNRGVG